MPSSDPRSLEGQVWLQRFNSSLQSWIESGRSRDDLLVEAAQSLEHLLERAPDYARQVHRIALTACFNARMAAGPDAVAALARVGVLADPFLSDDDPESGAARVLLHLYQAEADLRRQARFDGYEAVGRAGALLEEIEVAGSARPYVTGFRWHLQGSLAELALDNRQAARAYERAADALDPIALDADRLVETSMALVRMLFGDAVTASPAAQQVLMLAAHQVRAVVSRNALNRARALALVDGVPPALAADLWATVRACGIPDDASPIDFAPLVTGLPDTDATEAAALLVERVGTARGRPDDWDAVLHSALIASAHAGSDRAAGWGRRLQDALGGIVDPLAYAFVSGTMLRSLPEEVDAEPFAAAFLDALRDLLEHPDHPLDDLRVRSLFDDAVARSVRCARTAWEADPGPRHRTRLAVLLDALRGTRLTRIPGEPFDGDPVPGEGEPSDDPAAAMLLAADRLQRIAHALRDRPDALALVQQEHRDGCTFFCASGDPDSPLRAFEAPVAFVDAMSELVRALDEDAGLVQLTGDLPPGDRIADLGRTAHDLLPSELRDAIARHPTLLVAPDFRGASHVALELLHDGDVYLGVGHVVARFVSVRALTRSVERLSTRVPHRRALLLSASRVHGWDELPLSRTEVATVRETLSGHGWDAPEIAEDRLSGEFLVDRLPLVAHAHIAAHGVVAGEEALVLADDSRLTVDHLLERRFPHLPVVFLNTCSLGRTRYIGAGISRGIAHTLVEAGAPACVANLLPVEDSAASDLALEFYRQAEQHPLGEALRRARKGMAESGVHPMLWGSTVMIGDPWVTLDPVPGEGSLTDRLLDAWFSLQPDDERNAGLWLDAQNRLSDEPDDVRLLAAVALIRLAADVPGLGTDALRDRWDRVVQLADEIDHLPAMAMTRVARLKQPDGDEPTASRLARIDEAIRFIEPLATLDELWSVLLMSVRGDRARILLRQRGLEMRTTGAEPGDQDEMRALMDAITDAQAQQEAVAGSVELRQPERTPDDIYWNAVVFGHGNRFEDMRETVAFTDSLVARLQRKGALPGSAAPVATPLLAALLYFIWRSQNLAYLAPDMADGWSATVRVACTELARDLEGHPQPDWLAHVGAFATSIDATLERIDRLAWEEVYQHLDPEMERLREEAGGFLQRLENELPHRISAATAWVMGTIMQKNTFSPLDGSVPESIGERLERVYFALESDAEGRFMPWLDLGFRSARERPMDELQRWKLHAPT